MITNLENKLKFIELVDEMKNIYRTISLKSGRKENDAEHTFHLAIMCFVFLDDFPFLNQEKVIKLALLHDIVEIFAGDTYVYDDNMLSTKKQRELDSLAKIEEILGKEEFQKFKILIEEYEEKTTNEAKFVSQLDKLQPIIQIYMTGGKDFFEYKTDTKRLLEDKYYKINSEFGFDKILDIYFKKMKEGNMFYNEV
ncbi:MAG: HD domain-containing protein [Candidatus Gracilibacteria bacterium]|nr:HD domain-containing protein [Candidatus Gracilibacteria bacterium]